MLWVFTLETSPIEFYTAKFSASGEWSASNLINCENRGDLEVSMCGGNFENNFGIFTWKFHSWNALNVDDKLLVKLFACAYIESITY